MENNIRRLRKKKGLTQAKLAIMLGVSCATLSAYECNKILPKADSVMIMTEKLNCTFNELFYFK